MADVTPSTSAQSEAVAAQIAYAVEGSSLDSAQHAESYSLFQSPPGDLAGAYRTAAYYTAVAARLIGDRALAGTATSYATQAAVYGASPLAIPFGAGDVLVGAGQAIKTAADASPSAGAVQAKGEADKLIAWSAPTNELTLSSSSLGRLYQWLEKLEGWAKTAAVVGGGLLGIASGWVVYRAIRWVRG